MITLNFKYKDNLPVAERELTAEEKETITSILTNGGDMTITYYQGDEPVQQIEQIAEPSPEKVDLISILSKATPEEINYIKQLLK